MSNRGFTIVELLIVIVVIAILASISVVAYNGIQQRARDAQRVQAVTNYIKANNLYIVQNGSDISTGGGVGDGTGWINVGSPPLTTTIQNSGVIANASGLRDPVCTSNETAGCLGFAKMRCGTRYAVIAKLETGGPTPSLPSELSGCTNSGWWNSYGFNYYKMGN